METAKTAGPHRPRHPERTVLYRVFAQHFERFVQVYDERFAPTARRDRPLARPLNSVETSSTATIPTARGLR